jgi:hypothetical protein
MVDASVSMLRVRLTDAARSRHEHVTYILQTAIATAVDSQQAAATTAQEQQQVEMLRGAVDEALAAHLESQLNSYHEESVAAVQRAVSDVFHSQLHTITESRRQQAGGSTAVTGLRSEVLLQKQDQQQQMTDALIAARTLQQVVCD